MPDKITAVFVQAPADLTYALEIVDRASSQGRSVRLIVVNVKSVYEYLLQAGVYAGSLHFVPYMLQPLPRLPWTLVQARRDLSARFRTIFAGTEVVEAYFFCARADAVTPYFIARLSKTATVFLFDHYGVPENRETRWPLRLAIKWLHLRLATGVSFRFCRESVDIGDRVVWSTTFDSEAFGILPTTIELSRARIPLPAGTRPKLILMESNDEVNPDLSGYPELLSELLSELERLHLTICLKVHPRTGPSAFLDRFHLPDLPAGCPIELFDLRGIAAVLGLASHGLAAVAKQGHVAISLIYLVGFHSETVRQFRREYMEIQSGGRVLFPRSITELVKMIKIDGLSCSA